MNVLIITNTGQNIIKKNVKQIPKINELVDCLYKPYPRVELVLNYPSEETLSSLRIGSGENVEIDAIVTVS